MYGILLETLTFGFALAGRIFGIHATCLPGGDALLNDMK